jgi:hypothetical protein
MRLANHYLAQVGDVAANPMGVRLAMSMGYAIQRLLANKPPQRCQQYFSDRQRVLDDQMTTNTANLDAPINRCNELELDVLRAARVIVTSYETALSANMMRAKSKAVLIFTDANSVPFTSVAGVMTRLPEHHAAFICGDAADYRHPVMKASGGQTEAVAATSFSAWQHLTRANSAVPHALT